MLHRDYWGSDRRSSLFVLMLGHRLVRTTADEAKRYVFGSVSLITWTEKGIAYQRRGLDRFAWGTQTQDQRFLNWDRQIQCNGKGSDSGLMGDLVRIIEFLRSWFRNRGHNKDFVTGMQPSVKRAFLFVLRNKVTGLVFLEIKLQG